MKTVPLGNTGVQVSALCLGAMYMGTTTDEAQSFRLLDQYVAAGGTFIDTANIYSHWVPGGKGGESEALLGRWMHERRNRDKLFIASKVGFNMPGVERGLSRRQIEVECDKSLNRLGVDTIDLYYAHVDDRITSLEETLAAFNWLVGTGKVRFIGASNFRAWRLDQARTVSMAAGYAEYCCIQQRHTYLRPRPGATFGPQLAVNDDLSDYIQSQGGDVTLLAYSALLGGAYTRADRPIPPEYAGPDSEARLAALRAVAAEHGGATPNQIVLAWMMQNDPPVLPLIAASTSEQLQENLGALAITLTEDQMTRLNEAGTA